MELVNRSEEIMRNALRFDSYRYSASVEDKEFYRDRIRLGNIFIFFNINDKDIFCPSRFAGYKNNNRQEHVGFPQKNGTHTTEKINSIIGQNLLNNEIEAKYKKLCATVDVVPADRMRRYWSMPMSDNLLKAIPLYVENHPDELPPSIVYVEGSTKQVTVNAYERNEKARKKCIEYYGHKCAVCGLAFKKYYGEIGAGFIHVHHLMPVSVMKQKYELDPIADLRPVCPNCHAMLHKNDPPFSIPELKKLINKNQVRST